MNRPGKGITKDRAIREEGYTFAGYFRMLKNRFWNLSSLNILYVIMNFPIFFGLIALSGAFNVETTMPTSPFYPVLFGISQYGETPYITALLSILGGNVTWSVATTTTKCLGLLTLLVVFTGGITNVGATYVIRGYLKSEPVFLFGDFFGAIKKNFLQGMILGLLDAFFVYALGFGLMTYYINAGNYALSVMFFAELLLAFVYLTMRFYMYMLLITFDISIPKLIKNSFIFAIIGYKRNTLAWLGILAFVIINVYVFMFLMVFGVILPFIITASLLMFTGAYASYPVIKKYMIDPYYKNETNEKLTPAEEPIFIDRG